MQIMIRPFSDMPCAAWQGGKTFELAIGPEGTRYADRNFGFRISSATVDADASVFTLLPDYDRFLMPLSDALQLFHEDCAPVRLEPLQTCFFDGGLHTRSVGRAQDFNLMLRKNVWRGDMQAHRFAAEERVCLPALRKDAVRVVYLYRGRARLDGCGALAEGNVVQADGRALSFTGETGGVLVEAWAARC